MTVIVTNHSTPLPQSVALRKYLDRYASAESSLGALVRTSYDHVLVVPVRGEEPSFLDGYEQALARGSRRTLIVVVANASAALPERADEASVREGLLTSLGRVDGDLADNVAWWCRGDHDLVVIDRASPGRELPGKGGVGHARKIGTDFALQLWASGKLTSPWIHMTDADARLPRDYFRSSDEREACDAKGPRDAVAMLYPFTHGVSDDRELSDAHALYEISLRHYVLGLRRADSPYAFHSIGSCIAVRADALATVRGVPKREAGEDFYFLDKLAKVGRIAPAATNEGTPIGTIDLAPRRSARAPFGTGPAVDEISRLADWETYSLYDPTGFEVLAAWLGVLDECSAARSVAPFDEWIASLSDPIRVGVTSYLESQRAREAVSSALAAGHGAATARRRLHTWFDGLKTLRLVHAVRDSGFPKRPWRQAIVDTQPAHSAPLLETGTAADVCGALRRIDVGSTSPLGARRIGWTSGESVRTGEL